MRLLQEIRHDAIGTLLQVFDGLGSPIRGVTVSMQESSGDPFIIESGVPLAMAQVFNGLLVVSGGPTVEFGGPVCGPLVGINWQGTITLKRAIIRFWDSPIPAYGRLVMAHFDELAVAAGTDSGVWSVDPFGTWARSQTLLWTGTQVFEPLVGGTWGTVTPTQRLSLGAGSANKLQVSSVVPVADTLDIVLNNNGAVAGDVSACMMVTLGS